MGRLKEDLLAYSEGKMKKCISTILFNPGFRATMNYRIANFMYKKAHLQIISKLLWWHTRKKYAYDIDYRCEIEGGFRIVHGIGLVIGKDVRIGKNVAVYQGVTLGGNSNKTSKKDGIVFSQPWIGNNVIIYADCTVLGPVCIESNSVIGAGSTILKDVPADRICYTEKSLVMKVK